MTSLVCESSLPKQQQLSRLSVCSWYVPLQSIFSTVGLTSRWFRGRIPLLLMSTVLHHFLLLEACPWRNQIHSRVEAFLKCPSVPFRMSPRLFSFSPLDSERGGGCGAGAEGAAVLARIRRNTWSEESMAFDLKSLTWRLSERCVLHVCTSFCFWGTSRIEKRVVPI